jgi:hypothetical protein
MHQKTRKGSKNEDRWLGPYEVIDIRKTSCTLKNKSGKRLKTCVNLNQLKPYLKHVEEVEQIDEVSAAKALILLGKREEENEKVLTLFS